jgi:hypothetical protein
MSLSPRALPHGLWQSVLKAKANYTSGEKGTFSARFSYIPSVTECVTSADFGQGMLFKRKTSVDPARSPVATIKLQLFESQTLESHLRQLSNLSNFLLYHSMMMAHAKKQSRKSLLLTL